MSAGGGRDLEAEAAAAWASWELQLNKTVQEHDRAETYRAAWLSAQAELEEARARIAELEAVERWKGVA